MKEGTLAVLLQSGLDEKWRADSMECYCCLRNVQDLLSDGKNLVKSDLEKQSKGQQFLLEQWLNIIRFQCDVNQELHQFDLVSLLV